MVSKGRKPVEFARFRIEDKAFRTLPIGGLRCNRRLPAGAEMALVIGERVQSVSGLARGQVQRLAFRVRPDFSAAFRCPRVNAQAQCLPTGAMRVDFSAPVSREVAARVRLAPAKGACRGCRASIPT